jgi:hypothetical protein
LSNAASVKALILCAGSGKQWGEYLGRPKQLIVIDNESLLDRMARLLRDHGVTDIDIVSNDDRLRIAGCGFFRPTRYRWTVQTLLSTRELWRERTLVLLGDVYYSEAAIRTIIRFKGNLRVFGRPGRSSFTHKRREIFALSFDSSCTSDVVQSASVVLEHAMAGGMGKLTQLYRSLVGFPLERYDKYEREVFLTINDLTDDFDHPKQYDRFLRRYRWATSTNSIERLAITIWLRTLAHLFALHDLLVTIAWRGLCWVSSRVPQLSENISGMKRINGHLLGCAMPLWNHFSRHDSQAHMMSEAKNASQFHMVCNDKDMPRSLVA